jgi:hypothetical protein
MKWRERFGNNPENRKEEFKQAIPTLLLLIFIILFSLLNGEK